MTWAIINSKHKYNPEMFVSVAIDRNSFNCLESYYLRVYILL